MWKPSFVLAARHGASKIIAAIYRYGAPPAVNALQAVMEEDERQRDWQTYVADVGCTLVKLWSRKSKLPYYSELTRPQTTKTDSRSKQEIVNDLLVRRRKRRRVEVMEPETV